MTHNCNNFSNDFATFLLGSGIPDNILDMPRKVASSPLGRMFMGVMDSQVSSSQQGGDMLGFQTSANDAPAHSAVDETPRRVEATVRTAKNLSELNGLLDHGKKSFAVVFFTSATCAPCRSLYPVFDSLAAEVGSMGVLIKVDTSQAFDVGSKYAISGTPTFITYLKGNEESRWSGADPARLRGDVQLLMQMAWPRHPHENLNLPTFARTNVKPILYTKLPPLEKLLKKMGSPASDPAFQATKQFIETRSKEGPAEATLPDVLACAAAILSSLESMPLDLRFTAIDFLRIALIDPRYSGVLAEQDDHEYITSILKLVNSESQCPYNLRLVTLQMACNLFSSPLYSDQILTNEKLRSAITQLLSSSFLDDKNNSVRVAAASLLFNVALANSQKRIDDQEDVLPQDDQIELAASAMEAITRENSSVEALEGMLQALGYLVYRAPLDGQLVDLLRTLDAGTVVLEKQSKFPELKLVKEVGDVLLGKGLQRP